MNDKLYKELTEHIAIQFDKIKDEKGLTYEKDFEAFALGYTMGIFGTLNTVGKDNIRKKAILGV